MQTLSIEKMETIYGGDIGDIIDAIVNGINLSCAVIAALSFWAKLALRAHPVGAGAIYFCTGWALGQALYYVATS